MEDKSKERRLDEQASDLAAEERPGKRLATSELGSSHDSSGVPHRSNEPGARLEFRGQGIQQSGSGNINARDIYIGRLTSERRDR